MKVYEYSFNVRFHFGKTIMIFYRTLIRNT